MTPAEIILAARRRFNAVSDNFWGDQELYDVLYAALLEVCGETYAAERTYTSTTVSGTQSYDFPTNAIAIKRATWDGRKLTPIDMREDDAITGLNMTTTDTGNPEYYWIWNRAIYLRPVPSSAATLKLWTLNTQDAISTGTTEIVLASEHHPRLINPVLAGMMEKDQNFRAAEYYLAKWERDKNLIQALTRKSKRADGFASVKDENMMVETYIA